MLPEELAVGGQVGRSDRRRDGVLFRRCFAARLRRPRGGEHRGHHVLAEPLGDEVHGRSAAVAVEHTVERLREEVDKDLIIKLCNITISSVFSVTVTSVFNLLGQNRSDFIYVLVELCMLRSEAMQ